MSKLHDLELKARIDWIAECLVRHLPGDFVAAVTAIRASLPPALDPALTDDDFGTFIIAPLGEFAVKQGLEFHPDLALDLLEDLTQRFSMEWALRPFLNEHPDKTLARLERWMYHPSYHVRRLVSEGTRPKLPWGIGIGLTPEHTIALLTHLHADKTRFVTRSVANHLNDISKTDPDLVVSCLGSWASDARQSQGELDWMTRHALRGLIKAGHPDALGMLGYDPDAEVTATLRAGPDPLQVGQILTLDIDITGPANLPVMVDYVLRLHRPKGAPGRKVFKLKQGKLDANGHLHLRKSQRLQTGLSSYRLHPGPQSVAVQINGCIRAEMAFDVIA